MLKNNDTIVPLFNQSSLLLEEKKKSSIVVIFKNACTNFHKLSIFSTIRILYKILYILCNESSIRFNFQKEKKNGTTFDKIPEFARETFERRSSEERSEERLRINRLGLSLSFSLSSPGNSIFRHSISLDPVERHGIPIVLAKWSLEFLRYRK